MQKPATTKAKIDATIAARWSPRSFDDNKSVTQEQIIALLEAARWAPSCFGDQPWRFVVFDKVTDKASWQSAFDCLAETNQTWVKNTSLLILVCADTLFGHNHKPNRWGQYDTGAAAENLCLEATSMGLAAHQMGGFNADAAREKFNIPEQYTLMAMIAVGYQADVNQLSEELKERELAPRKRKELGELFFSGMWDKPVV
ncbi:MAG: nitroreductase family protein [Methylophilus sp.]